MIRMRTFWTTVLCLALCAGAASAAGPAAKPGDKKPESKLNAGSFSGLKFRNIGPALTSGRIVDVAVHPQDKSTWYVAAAYGGVWKTTNAGTTWKPIFDGQGTSSIGCVAVDPSRPLTVWVGSGENNSQRAVGWGDGVYRSDDGGRTWSNVGLKASEHIGMVAIHPKQSNVVLVAAQGPLWAPGGDRGVYKTTDGGKTWKRVLYVDEWTGGNEVWFDPHDPEVLYAATYQRHRKEWTLIDGGPGSGVWKSTDGGETWKKLAGGLPTEDMGKIGLTLPKTEPNAIVAVIEAANGKSGMYRSNDAGANWEKISDTVSGSPQYYNELFSDPNVPGRLYLVDTFLQTSDDGGRTWRRAGEKNKHVDNHLVWVDPDDSRHLLVGCDGGLYETFDRCATWKYFGNLPITQFYKLEVDDSKPFYYVYGGTQDNNTQGGPSRTNNVHGIRNSDWFITVGGDGFQPRVEPTNPNIVYSESQHGGLARYDRATGEQVDIQPQPAPGEAGSRWNWDSPLIISPFSPTRLYFASQRIYRSDDRGDTWKPVSGDLSRGVERNKLPVMGRVWSIDAVAKNASTTVYGNVVALFESPLKEGLLYAGTDDGLIHVSEDGGANWRRVETPAGVGDYAYVTRVVASQHALGTVYATYDRHRMGDLKPYVLKSTDMGRTWTNITADLPVNGSVYAFAEDHVDPNLLFVGTEFGAFFSQDGGRKWIKLTGNLPVQSVRDIAIQKREGDLVLATFSRGFWILDDYSPLRSMKEPRLNEEAALLPVRKAGMYVPASPMGGAGPAEQGTNFYTAENPPYGAVFTYWLRDEYQTLREQRHEREKAQKKAGQDSFYPSWDSLRTEAGEEAPEIVLTVTDGAGNVVRRLKGSADAGFHRVAWDFRWSSSEPAVIGTRTRGDWDDTPNGPLAVPGTYTVSLAKRVRGELTPLGQPQQFVCEPLLQPSLPAANRDELLAFSQKTARLQRAVLGGSRVLGEMQSRLPLLAAALDEVTRPTEDLRAQLRAIRARLDALNTTFYGDRVLRRAEEATPPSLVERVNQVVSGHWNATGAPTTTHRRNYDIAAADFATALEQLRGVQRDLQALEAKAEAAGAPWTPGRLPEWKPE
ncbi:MAG: glycosyl hydrolase [Candidatus Eisenbacteria bacterium]